MPVQCRYFATWNWKLYIYWWNELMTYIKSIWTFIFFNYFDFERILFQFVWLGICTLKLDGNSCFMSNFNEFLTWKLNETFLICLIYRKKCLIFIKMNSFKIVINSKIQTYIFFWNVLFKIKDLFLGNTSFITIYLT